LVPALPARVTEPEGDLLADVLRLRPIHQALERGVGRGIAVHRDRRDGTVGDAILRVSLRLRADERFEQRNAVGRAHVLQPVHWTPTRIELAIFRKDADSFDRAIGNAEQHDHLIRSLELDDARGCRRLRSRRHRRARRVLQPAQPAAAGCVRDRAVHK
jgi:hypothetical protein